MNSTVIYFLWQFYSITVPEGQQFQTEYRVFARDADSGAFGQVRYSLSGRGSHNFYLNPDTVSSPCLSYGIRPNRPRDYDRK